LVERWTRFWFAPVPATGLNGLRFLAGLLFAFWLLSLVGQQEALFGLEGWVDRKAYVAMSSLPEGPPNPLGWSFLYLAGSSASLLSLLYWGSIGILVLFTLGIATRVTAVLTWVVVVSFLANPVTRYEADYLLVILAFYLMIGYLFLGQFSRKLSPAERLLGPRGTSIFGSLFGGERSAQVPSHAAGVAVRLLQVHFALVVVVTGFHKLQFARWWGGMALWFPLHPPLETTPADIRAEVATKDTMFFFLSLAEYLILAWQIGFPLFAWRKSLRLVLLGGAAVGWLGCIFLIRQPLYGPFFVIASLSYLTPEEWRWIGDRISHGLRRLAPGLSAAAEKKVRIGAQG
jgi:hypothetical protein